MAILRACVVVLAVLVACSEATPGAAPTGDAAVDASDLADGTAGPTATADANSADGGGETTLQTAADAGARFDAAVDSGPTLDGGADGSADLDAAADASADAGQGLDAPTDGGPEASTDAVAETVPDAGLTLDADTTVETAADTAADATAVDTAPEVVAEVPPGCADGTREGFLDKKKYPLVAACAGAWDIPGVHKGNPACGRKAGNTGVNAPGKGCNVEDLCADGWHVCYGAKDLKERNPEGCGGILDGGGMSPAFFLARTSSTGAFNCAQDSTKFGDPGTSNDLFGCGDLGCGIDFKTYPSCDPLNRASHDLCKGLRNDLNCGDWCAHLGKFPAQKNTWDCGKNAPTNEANLVVKSDPLVQGGVLCCVDFISKP